MLRSSALSLVLVGVSIPMLLAFGCTVTSTSSSPTASTSDGAGAGSSVSSTSVVSTTGVVSSSASTTTAGEGGAGGGTETTASSSTGAGGGACTDPTGTGAPVDANCDAIPSAGAISTCGAGGGAGAGTDPPPDPGVCHLGFKIYTTGAAEELASCLNNILLGASGDNCADADPGGPIQMCVTEIYDNACANPQSDGACDSIATACAGEAFDVATCKRDLAVFNEATLTSFGDCMNASPTDPCQMVYDDCFVQATTVQ